jgi:transmembrane sensor
MIKRETAGEIEAAAARWVVRLDRDGRTPELEAELEAWQADDPRRRGALLQAEAAWAMLDRGSQLTGAAPVAPPKRARPLPRRALLAGGGAAIAASLAGVAYLGLARERYRTAVGEIRRVPLADGSTAAINTTSVIEVAMTPRRRVVRLDRGEAWFQVAKNPQRPFLVEAGRIRVQAVGTAFAVRRQAAGAEVLVTEGVVEAWTVGAEGQRARISAGGRAFVADNAAVEREAASADDVDRALAWRVGKIDLAGETLLEAANEFNRYNARKLRVTDPRLAQERLYGVFRTDDPAGFASAVRQSLGADVSFEDPDEIRIGGG